MKASPMKITQVVPGRGKVERDGLRRDLFQRRGLDNVGKQETMTPYVSETEITGDTRQEATTKDKVDTENQLQELLSSLAKVEVGASKKSGTRQKENTPGQNNLLEENQVGEKNVVRDKSTQMENACRNIPHGMEAQNQYLNVASKPQKPISYTSPSETTTTTSKPKNQ